MVLVLRQHKIVAQSGVWMVAFADESQVVAGYHNGDIRWWKIDDEQQYVGTTMQVGHGIASLECGHSRKKTCVRYTRSTSRATVQKSPSGDRLLPPLPHGHVVGVKFSPDGFRLATASFDRGIRIYTVYDGSISFDSGFSSSFGTRLVTPLTRSSY